MPREESMLARSDATRMVVTGGAGFIGSHLCDALLARGHHVTCIDSLVGTHGSVRNVEHLLGDDRFELVVEDVLSWSERASLEGVDCVFHLAASKNGVCMADPERDLAVNALGTLRIARAAARDGVRKLVHSSTGSVAGAPGDGVPVSYYGASKLAGESYCRVVGDLCGIDCTILRYYHVIGPRQDGSDSGGVVPIFARRALSGEPLTIDGDGLQTRSFTSVRDAVRANLVALEHGGARGRTLTCASGLRVSIRELADYVIDLTSSRAGIRQAPVRPGDIRHFDVDNSHLRGLGLEFETDWQGMVREVVASLAAPRAAA